MIVDGLKTIACACLVMGAVTSAAAQSPREQLATAALSMMSPKTIQSSREYYIEFRAAQIGAYGHSYAAFGRLNAHGQPGSVSYADLHPMGNYAIMAIGHLLPVPANTEWDPDVLKLPIASKYRVNLTANQYHKLLAALRRARADKQPVWNAISNNCNHFIAKLAQAVQMRIPTEFQLSYAFIPALRELNESNQSAGPSQARLPSKPVASGR